MPVLVANGTYDTWTFSVTDDVPPQWNLYRGPPGGGSYVQVDNEVYGFDGSYGGGSGDQLYGVRADALGNDYGPISNIITVP